jgi:hypothetical protein
MVSILIGLISIGKTCIQGVKAESLDLKVSHARPVRKLILKSVCWSLRLVEVTSAGA